MGQTTLVLPFRCQRLLRWLAFGRDDDDTHVILRLRHILAIKCIANLAWTSKYRMHRLFSGPTSIFSHDEA